MKRYEFLKIRNKKNMKFLKYEKIALIYRLNMAVKLKYKNK